MWAACAQGDVRKSSDCDRWVAEAVSQLGHLDILVNCAAGNFLVGAPVSCARLPDCVLLNGPPSETIPLVLPSQSHLPPDWYWKHGPRNMGI